MSEHFLNYDQLLAVKTEVDQLVPGYFAQELDPIAALEKGQGNCFTNSIIAAADIANRYNIESSVAWLATSHAIPRPLSIAEKSKSNSADKSTELQIGHIELVVPRGGDPFDILGLAYGMVVQQGNTYKLEDRGGQIENYNFGYDPRDTSVDKPRNRSDDAMVYANDEGEVLPTEYGKSLNIIACDWRHGADEYLRALNLPPLDYDELEQKVACFVAALVDGRDCGAV